MGAFRDITGERFGRLVVLGREEDYVSPKGHHATNWRCLCDCGRETIVRGCNLRSGASRSCGCIRVDHPNRTTHGLSKSRIYTIWTGMKNRCFNPNDISYPDYGGRGITVCEEWINNFESFYTWSISNGYDESLSIDRINNNGNYSPQNCRWATNYEQGNNTRHNHMVTYNGETLTVSQWSQRTGIRYKKLIDRLNKCGWSVEAALTTP